MEALAARWRTALSPICHGGTGRKAANSPLTHLPWRHWPQGGEQLPHPNPLPVGEGGKNLGARSVLGDPAVYQLNAFIYRV